MNIKILFSILILLVISTITFAQEKYEDYWEKFLNNERQEALDIFTKKKKSKTIEYLVTKELLLHETGKVYNNSPNFVNSFTEMKDFEYFLYAFWMNNILFDEYLSNGFNSHVIANIDKFSNVEFKNPRTKASFEYLEGVSYWNRKDITGYYKKMNAIQSIQKWQFCGVFENLNQSGLDIEYAPEKNAFSSTDFNTNSNGKVNWYKAKGVENESYIFFSNHNEYGYGVNYAQTFIEAKETKRVQLRMGNSSAFKVWLNDVLVFENDKDVNTDLDNYNIEVTIPKGNNRLLVKNAENNGESYFIIRITDLNGKSINDYLYNTTYTKYNNSTKESLNVIKMEDDIARFFKQKIKDNPNSYLYTKALLSLYIRNENYEDAKKIIIPLLEKYPKSTDLKSYYILVADLEKDYAKVEELKNNILKDDENSLFSIVIKATDFEKLSQLDMDEFEIWLNKLNNSTDNPLLKKAAAFMLYAKKEDISGLKQTLEEIMTFSDYNPSFTLKFIPIYTKLFNDDERVIQELEKITKQTDISGANNYLIGMYDKKGEKNKVANAYKDKYNQNPYAVYPILNYVKNLHENQEYKRSIPVLEKSLQDFPYSFILMEKLGDAYAQIGKEAKAIKLYNKSLEHNNTNTKLRKKIETINRTENIVDNFSTKDIYDFIEKNRNKITENNYGLNILLDEKIVQIFDNGSIKTKTSTFYEITNESAIKNYKEINLNLDYGYTILKSEIVKKDNSLSPAESSGSSFVFNNLEIGDVIVIQYVTESVSSGRFYKDFVDYFQFDGSAPSIKTNYTILAPKGKKIYHRVMNGEIALKKNSIKDYDTYTWESDSLEAYPMGEYCMPNNVDLYRYIHISTINSWTDIANWYSDLVRSQSIYDAEVAKAFESIFPNETYKSMNNHDKAKAIYNYISQNFNYSFVNFKQSGFIPQKPSKTITTKLGDCKDFSTLFVTLARKAELPAKLVLIQTSDYGKNSMILPSQDFNHCIVKTEINDQEQYLELTDKNLPFMAIPQSLIGATALEIPIHSDKNTKSTISKLENPNRIKSSYNFDVNIKINDDDSQEILIYSTIKGAAASYYNSVLKESNYELVKKTMTSNIKNRMGENVILDSVFITNKNSLNDVLSFTTKVHIEEKLQEIGSIKIIKIPYVIAAYTRNIASLEKRKYPLEYTKYEDTELYSTTYTITIGNEKSFIEYPENIEKTFKGHYFCMNYEKIKDNELKVTLKGIPDLSLIATEDYTDFKTFIENITEAKKELIGFK